MQGISRIENIARDKTSSYKCDHLMKKCCPGDYPYVQVTFVIDIQTFMVISDLASGPVHQCAYVCRQPKFQLKSENDGQLPS